MAGRAAQVFSTPLIKAEYFDPRFFADSAFGRLISEAQAYRWVIKSPVRNYFGDTDEAITVGVGRMAQTYAQALGAGNPSVQAISTGNTTLSVSLQSVTFDLSCCQRQVRVSLVARGFQREPAYGRNLTSAWTAGGLVLSIGTTLHLTPSICHHVRTHLRVNGDGSFSGAS